MSRPPDAATMAHKPGEGSRSKYARGCRCDECRAAHASYQREHINADPARMEAHRNRNRRWYAERGSTMRKERRAS